MGRPSNREERRQEILIAFARVLAQHGYAGATIAAVANEAGVAPGLVHHHFDDKAELLSSLLKDMSARFRQRVQQQDHIQAKLHAAGTHDTRLHAYVDAALKLDERADLTAAKCWVSIFAEAVRSPTLFEQMRRLIDTEIAAIQSRSGHRLSNHDASAVLAFVIGSLVMGAFAPRKTAGFAAPSLRKLIATLM